MKLGGRAATLVALPVLSLGAGASSAHATVVTLGPSAIPAEAPKVGVGCTVHCEQPLTVTLTFTRALPGRRAHGGRCVAPTHRNRGGARCKRTVTEGVLPVSGHAGLDKVRFQGSLSRTRRLSPGSYAVTVRDAAGGKALTRPLNFTILP